MARFLKTLSSWLLTLSCPRTKISTLTSFSVEPVYVHLCCLFIARLLLMQTLIWWTCTSGIYVHAFAHASAYPTWRAHTFHVLCGLAQSSCSMNLDWIQIQWGVWTSLKGLSTVHKNSNRFKTVSNWFSAKPIKCALITSTLSFLR